MKKHFLFSLSVFCLSFLVQNTIAQNISEPPQTIEELRSVIEDIVLETNIPAAGVALVNSDGSVWSAGFGKADIEKDIDASEKTMFRLASVSKMFAALSILKLQEEGKVSLKDKVSELVPEIWFENEWEETNPVLVEHLLEHTTGWDDWHLEDFANTDTRAIPLKEGLDKHPGARISRWVPGTRMAYSNAGASVAAYIVEEISGLSYEDYIQSSFFDPLEIQTMTFLKSDDYIKNGAALYRRGKPLEYLHLNKRPAGALNASPSDMVKMLQFFINQGRVDSLQLISKESFYRLITPETSSGAKAGLENGYGLANIVSNMHGIEYYGHGGGLPGASSLFIYNPELGIGCCVAINTVNMGGVKIVDQILSYLTKDLEVQSRVIRPISVSPDLDIRGSYLAINSRFENMAFMENLLNTYKIWIDQDTIYSKGIGSGASAFQYIGHNKYASAENGKVLMVKTADPIAGEVLHVSLSYSGSYNEVTLKKISSFRAVAQRILFILFQFLCVSSIIWGILWFIVNLFRKSKWTIYKTRVLPSIASLIIFVYLTVYSVSMTAPILPDKLLGTVNFVSVLFMLSTIAYVILSVFSVFYAYKERKSSMKRFTFWYFSILTGMHVLASVYLLWHGVIGSRTWI